ncbi:hypothetical protein MRX96_002651 [Rhipicephalus microplus]
MAKKGRNHRKKARRRADHGFVHRRCERGSFEVDDRKRLPTAHAVVCQRIPRNRQRAGNATDAVCWRSFF